MTLKYKDNKTGKIKTVKKIKSLKYVNNFLYAKGYNAFSSSNGIIHMEQVVSIEDGEDA